jgi:hypothetical protein
MSGRWEELLDATLDEMLDEILAEIPPLLMLTKGELKLS